MFVYLLAFALAAVGPSPTPSPVATPSYKPVTWQGVTLGENLDLVRARLGRPIFIRKIILGESLVEYPLRGTDATMLLTGLEGRVSEIRLEAPAPKQLLAPVSDPFGVSLGDSVYHLLAARGNPNRYYDDGEGEGTSYYGETSTVRWVYTIRDNVVYAISVQAPKPPPPVVIGPRGTLVLQGTPKPKATPIILHGTPRPHASAGPLATTAPPLVTPTPSHIVLASTPSPGPLGTAAAATTSPGGVVSPSPGASESPDGKSVQTAILVKAPDQSTGFIYIYRYVESLPCGDGSADWRVVNQDILFENRRNYAKVVGECPTTHERRTWYFDITLWFTRGDIR